MSIVTTLSASKPVRYQPSHEQPEKDEAVTEKDLCEAMRKIQETTYKDGGHAMRAVHAKSHGLLRGELHVFADLPPHLAQGLFARAGTFPLVMRLSTIPGDILDDNVSTPRGMAIKIVGVEGERLPGSQGAQTQDFLLVNAPAFLKKDGKSFLSSLKMLAATTDKAPGAKKVLSTVLQVAEKLVESMGGESPTLISMGGHPETHPLGDTYYSQTPYLYGEYMAKFALAPVSDDLMALTKAPLDLDGSPNGLRDAVDAFFAGHAGTWELRVQLCTDVEAMPIENPQTPWSEDQSPYVSVARLVVTPQAAWSEARSAAVDDGLSFSPWHGLAAHRPLGSVNRMRRKAYEMARQFRADRNGRSVEEPKTLENLPA
ncbi:MAG: catalase family protein [Panacagrimonas sp.]